MSNEELDPTPTAENPKNESDQDITESAPGDVNEPQQQHPEDVSPSESEASAFAEASAPQKQRPNYAWVRPLLRSAMGMIRQGWQVLLQEMQDDGYSPLTDVREAFNHLNLRRIGLALLGLALLAYLLSGIYTVRPGEVAVVQRFGAVVAPRVTEGLHFRLPWPIEKETIVNVAEVRREGVGLVESEPEHLHLESAGKLQVLSGDTNIVDYEVIVQYQISDPTAYLFNVDYAAYQLVREAVRAAVTRLSGSTSVDGILTTERQSLQNQIRQEVQTLLDGYNSGLAVVGVNFQKAYPPDEVADAFRDVSSAREDKARAVNEAEGYRNSIIPEARGQANRTLAEAAGFARVQQDQAIGAAQAFEAILTQYQINSRIYGEDVTRFRLYLETMEQVLPTVQTYVVQPNERVSLRLLNGAQVNTFPPGLGGQ